VPLCGYVTHYNDRDLPSGPDRSLLLWDALLSKRLRVQGFIVDDHADRSEAFRREMETWLREGSIVYREDIVDGPDRAPERLAAMLRGETFGKALIQVDA
jgi:NADPH-dependent curcumin reductase CurA